MIRAGVSGAGGLVGEGLVRALLGHPELEITYLGSSHAEGMRVVEEFPGLEGFVSYIFDPLDSALAAERCDVVFLAHKGAQSMEIASRLCRTDTKVVDIGGEFRLRDKAVYEKWYGNSHTAAELLSEAAYGLPELFREEIKAARLVANPGCYPTGMLLLCAPLVQEGLINDNVQVASFSGMSGAGRRYQEKTSNLFIDCNENVHAYSALRHKHQPEMEDALERFSAHNIRVSFTPHLLPVDRGIITSVWVTDLPEAMHTEDLVSIFQAFYEGEPFVRVRADVSRVSLKSVYSTNFCDVGGAVTDGVAYLTSAIDNTTKGAVTQAVQNMNIMFGLDETLGLLRPCT